MSDNKGFGVDFDSNGHISDSEKYLTYRMIHDSAQRNSISSGSTPRMTYSVTGSEVGSDAPTEKPKSPENYYQSKSEEIRNFEITVGIFTLIGGLVAVVALLILWVGTGYFPLKLLSFSLIVVIIEMIYALVDNERCIKWTRTNKPHNTSAIDSAKKDRVMLIIITAALTLIVAIPQIVYGYKAIKLQSTERLIVEGKYAEARQIIDEHLPDMTYVDKNKYWAYSDICRAGIDYDKGNYYSAYYSAKNIELPETVPLPVEEAFNTLRADSEAAYEQHIHEASR